MPTRPPCDVLPLNEAKRALKVLEKVTVAKGLTKLHFILNRLRVTVKKAISRYVMFLRAEENKSPLTVVNYEQSLHLLCDGIGIKNIDGIGKESVKRYKLFLHEFLSRSGDPLSITSHAAPFVCDGPSA